MAWLKAIRKGTKSIPNSELFNNVVMSIKTTKSGIKNIDDVFANLPFAKKGDELTVNGYRWRVSQADLRLGHIRKVLKEMKIPNNITAADEAIFKKLISSKVPEVEINKMNNNIKAAKRFHSDLDIKGVTGKEIKQKLSPKSKAKLEANYRTIFKIAGGVGGVAVGLYATIVFTNNIYNDLAKATKAREGCFVVSKVKNVTQSCKLILRSCGVANGTGCRGSIAKKLPYNISIMLNHFVTNNDNKALDDIEINCGIIVNKTNINTVLNHSQNIDKLQKFYKQKYSLESEQPPFANPCGLYQKTSGCVACNPSATTNSELYLDDSELGENYSLQCVTDSTVLETLVDIATNMGIDLFDATSGSRGKGSLIVSIVVVLLVTVLFVSLGLKFFKTNKRKKWQNSDNEPLLKKYKPL